MSGEYVNSHVRDIDFVLGQIDLHGPQPQDLRYFLGNVPALFYSLVHQPEARLIRNANAGQSPWFVYEKLRECVKLRGKLNPSLQTTVTSYKRDGYYHTALTVSEQLPIYMYNNSSHPADVLDLSLDMMRLNAGKTITHAGQTVSYPEQVFLVRERIRMTNDPLRQQAGTYWQLNTDQPVQACADLGSAAEVMGAFKRHWETLRRVFC